MVSMAYMNIHLADELHNELRRLKIDLNKEIQEMVIEAIQNYIKKNKR